MVKKLLGGSAHCRGGIRSGAAAARVVKAGADLIVTGTAVERSSDVSSFVSDVTNSIRR